MRTEDVFEKTVNDYFIEAVTVNFNFFCENSKCLFYWRGNCEIN